MTAIDDQQDLYYRPMGKAPFAGTALAAIGSWLAVSVVAAIYAYADLYIKVAEKLTVLMTIGFAVAMGFVIYAVLRLTQVRNMMVVVMLSITSAALALYVSWVVWEY